MRFADEFVFFNPRRVDETTTPLNSSNVVLLVNENSPAGLEIVRLYREYHPGILDEQIIYLDGLTDCASLTASPADEIITRADFETYIAEPTRAHLISYGLFDQTYIIITTAGMPYRIEDTDPGLANVVMPAASAGQLTVQNRHAVNAASVESELSVLFLIDPAAPENSRMPINGRVVNPYHGYGSSIKRWANDRGILSRRDSFRWTYMWRIALSPKIEGDFDSSGFSAFNRRMSAGDLYLVARLDGPRPEGKYPIFAVRRMLERAARMSDPNHPKFVGLDPATAVVAHDSSPTPPAPTVFASSDMYNVPAGWDVLTYADHPLPPGAEEINSLNQGNHYFRLFDFLTGIPASANTTGLLAIEDSLGGIALWDDTASILNSEFIGPGEGIIGLLTYGRNGGDGRPPDYLLTSGPNGGPLFRCVPGAVFTSIESFNAVTMFADAPSNQGKIVDFIRMGGTAAVGHAFEPEVSAAIHVEYLYSNLLRDEDDDGVSDMTLAEAAFTGMHYVSWAEVLIGDPIMRYRQGPGGMVDITDHPGDANEDLIVGYDDLVFVLGAYGATLGDPNYNLLADLTEDGTIDDADLLDVIDNFGTNY